MTRRYRWPQPVIDSLPDGYAEDLILAHAGWDEAVEMVRNRQKRKGSPNVAPDRQGAIFGMPGVELPRGRIR